MSIKCSDFEERNQIKPQYDFLWILTTHTHDFIPEVSLY